MLGSLNNLLREPLYLVVSIFSFLLPTVAGVVLLTRRGHRRLGGITQLLALLMPVALFWLFITGWFLGDYCSYALSSDVDSAMCRFLVRDHPTVTGYATIVLMALALLAPFLAWLLCLRRLYRDRRPTGR